MPNPKKQFVSPLAALLLIAVCFTKASAQEVTSPQASSDLTHRLDVLEQKLTRLEERVNAALPPDAAALPQSDDRIQNLEAKLAVLEQDKQKGQQFAEPSNPAATKVRADSTEFSISNADGSFRLRFGGHVQLDGRTYYDDDSNKFSDTFLIRRARPILTGNLGKHFEFRLMPDFGNGTTQLFDAYGDVLFAPYLVLRGGKFKSPVGLEQLQNDADLTFIERSLVTDLLPNRDIGFELYGNFGHRLSYEFAALNGTTDGANIDLDTNDGKDLVGRLFATPFKSGVLQGLGFGAAASTGKQTGTVLPSYKSANGQATFFSYASSAAAAGNRLRYSPQMYYYLGPVGVLAEYAVTSQIIAGSTTHRVTNHGWNVEGSWILTGEKKRFGRFEPRDPHDTNVSPFHGAIEVAGRYSELNLDDAIFTYGYADSTKSARAARAWTIGTNYYMGRNTKLSLDYEQTRFTAGASTGNRPTERTFSQRLQFIF